MNLILLSGGSGKRLWPLSNDIRSKQFIRIFKKEDGTYESILVREEKDAFCLLLALGVWRKMAEEAAEQLAEKGIRVSVADARFVAPLSREWLLELSREYPRILTIEDHIHTGGFGIKVRDLLAEERAKSQVRILALPDRFIEQGKREVLLSRYGISVEGIQKAVENWNAEA